MSITTTQTPTKWTPVYNDMIFELSSDNIDEANFKYKVELYLDSSLIHTSEYYSGPTGVLTYNPKQILIDYIDFEFDASPTCVGSPPSPLEYYSSGEVLSYYIKVYENYDDISETLEYTSSEKYAINGAANYKECKNLDTYIENNFIPHSANDEINNAAYFMGPNKFVTDPMKVSQMYNLRSDQHKVVNFFTRNSETDYEPDILCVVTILKNEINGDSTKILYQDFDITANANIENDLGKLSINISDLNDAGWDSTQTNPGLSNYIDTEQDSYFIVYLSYDTVSRLTHRGIGFKILESDPIKHKDIKTIMYKSRKGGMWYVDAYQKSYEDFATEKQIRSKINYDNYSGSESYPKAHTIIEQENQSTYLLNTDWIKHEGDIEDIKDMIMSPDIYIIDVDNEVIPVILENSQYEFQSDKQYGLVQYSFSFREAFNKNTVR